MNEATRNEVVRRQLGKGDKNGSGDDGVTHPSSGLRVAGNAG